MTDTPDEQENQPTGENAINDALDAAAPPGLVIGGGDKPAMPPEDRARLPLNDYGNAMRLLGLHGRDMLHAEGVGWLYWDGTRWTPDAAEEAIRRMAHSTSVAIVKEAQAMYKLRDELEGDAQFTKSKQADALAKRLYKMTTQSGNNAKVKAMPDNAQPYIHVRAGEIDAHLDRFTCLTGTLILDADKIRQADGPPEEGEDDGAVKLQRHSRDARMTRCAPVQYDPDARAPQWEAFLETVVPDPSVRAFLKRFAGYCLTGETSEQVMLVLYGTGANGKSTMIETLGDVMGDYRESVPIGTFLHDDRGGGDATPDIAKLPGARLVLTSEPEVGDRLSESRVKTITGGERISARHLFQDMFEFMPQFKLVICVNTRPQVRGADEGIWRRLLMVPFETVVPPDQRDKHLRQKLMAEASGILNWALDGWREWADIGLAVPDPVRKATQAYRSDSDSVAAFLDDCCRRIEGATTASKMLYEAYQFYMREDQGGEPVNSNRFGRALSDKGFQKEKAGTIFYKGVEILDDLQQRIARAALPGGDDAM